MKPGSYLLILIIVLLSAAPGQLYAFKPQLKGACYAMGKPSSSGSQNQKKACRTEACSDLLVCNSCGFLMVNSVSIKAAFPALKTVPFALYTTAGISGFSVSCWNPPRA